MHARAHLPRFALGLEPGLLALACLVGALAGVLASGYAFALREMLKLSGHLGELVPVYVVMASAGLFVAASYILGHPGETDAVVDNIHVKNGRIDTRANLPLVPCSLVSIAAGGSAGPEAPMVYLTGSVGTWLHRRFKLPERYVRTLTFTGMGVGFATLFGAPVGSAIFALEIPHKRGMEYFEATIPAVLGCLVGYGVFAAIVHKPMTATWHFAPYHMHHPSELAIAAAVGLVCGGAALPYAWVINVFKRAIAKSRAPVWITATVGGAILGIIAWRLPATRFWGEEQLQHFVIDAAPAFGMLIVFAAAKMVTVAVTLAAGWRGGIIIPCFFIGACLGRALAQIIPGLDPTLAMLCGMAAVNVAIMKVPLATVLVVAGMSGVAAIPPITAAAFTAFVVSGGIDVLSTKRARTDLAPEEAASVAAAEAVAVAEDKAHAEAKAKPSGAELAPPSG